MGVPIAVAGLGRRRHRSQDRGRLLGVERGAAFSAEIIGSPELDQMTAVAPYYFS